MEEIKRILYEPTRKVDRKNLFKPKNYYDNNSDSINYKELKNVRALFEPGEDYYKPIRTANAFSSNYIEYESNGIRDKRLSIKDYLYEIESYLNDLIDDLQTQGEWKIQSTMAINIFYSKDSEESRIMHTKSDDIEIMIGNETNEIIEKIFDSLLQRHQKVLEES